MKIGKIKTKCVISYQILKNFKNMLLPSSIPYIINKKDMELREAINIYEDMLNIDDLKEYKSSKTLAILGSGYSINELEKEDYEFISSIDSIALNRWGVYHEFVPDFYKVEFPFDSNHRRYIIKKLNNKGDLYSQTKFIIVPEVLFWGKGINVPNFINKFHPNIRRDLTEIRLFIYNVEKKSDFNENILQMIFPTFKMRVPHYSGSLSQIIALGYYLGYENIILFGVDLNNSKYFWSDDPDAYQKTNRDTKPSDKHSTVNKDAFEGIDEYIYKINEMFFKPNNKHLYIGSKSSLLYPELEYFKDHFKY